MSTELQRQLRRLQTPAHVCPLYESAAEQRAIAAAFVEEGLRRGEHCVLLLSPTSEELAAAFRGRGIALTSERRRGALELSSAAEASLRGGEFVPDLLLEWLDRTERDVLSRGFSGLRVVSDATFATGTKGMEERLLEYEVKVETWIKERKASVVCLYDRGECDASVLYHVLRIHPFAVLGDLVCPNPYHEPPSLVSPSVDEASREVRRRRAEHWINTLHDARAAEVERERLESERAQLESKLHEAQKVAVVGQLAAGVAHEFNNFLAVIGAYVQVTRNRLGDDDPEHALLEQIQQATDSAGQLARQLSSLGRRDACAAAHIDANAVVRENEPMLRLLLGPQVELTLHLHPELEAVRIDPGELRQVLLNLSINARDAMVGRGRFILETRNTILEDGDEFVPGAGAPACYVELAARDNGVGMPKDVAARVFEPFFTTKPSGKGSGLGLPIVERIVQQAGGRIFVDSEPGVGTTFRILLPALRGAGGATVQTGEESGTSPKTS